MLNDFKKWIIQEFADFGFDKVKKQIVPINDLPEDPIDLGYVIEEIKRNRPGYKANDFFGNAQWGNTPGAVKLEFGPYGGLKAVIRKLSKNLMGEDRWICKKVVEIKDHTDANALAYSLVEDLNEVQNKNIDGPGNFAHLERLALRLAETLKRKTTQVIFINEGIKKTNENKYIIHFDVTGMGVQRQGQKRLCQFDVYTEYMKDEGLIRITGEEIGSSIANWEFQADPSQFQEWFSPAQSFDEIINAILAHFNSY